MPFPSYFLQRLEEYSPIEEIAPAYVQLKRHGRTLLGLCPFHNEKTPSFTVYPESNSFYCYGCHKGGGVIQFVMEAEHLAFTDAVHWLAQRAGLQIPEERPDDGRARLKTRILEMNREAGRFYFSMLSKTEGAAGLRYLRSRGLSNATIKRFGLGYAPNNGSELIEHLENLGYSEAELQAADLVRRSSNGNLCDRYRGRVMFPIFDLRGNVIAFGGRVLGDEKPKYINTSETDVYHKSGELFALNLAKNSGTRELILAEGYMDVIALHEAGFTNAIASLGTSLTEEQARIIKRYADDVVICYDADEAGRRATERAIPILKGVGLRVRVVTVPGGKDPDGFIRSHGEDGAARFKQLLKSSENDTEYSLEKIRSKYDLQTEDGKSRYLSEAVQDVLAQMGEIERDIYSGKLSDETGVSKESIITAAKKAGERLSRKLRRDEIRAQQRVIMADSSVNREKVRYPRQASAEEGIISYLFMNPENWEELEKEIQPEDFVTEWGQRVYGILLKKCSQGTVSITTLSEELSAEDISELTRIVNFTDFASPSWEDVKKFSSIIKNEGDFTNPEKIKQSSKEDLTEYLGNLKKSKS